MAKDERGYTQVYTGDGKGKTTAALGLALRALGRGLRVCLIQFLKNRQTGELQALKKFSRLSFKQFGAEQLVRPKRLKPVDKQEAQAGLRYTLQVLRENKYDMVILDEINQAVDFGLLPLADVLALIDDKPRDLELILTGRRAPRAILQRADLVTEMKKVKHYFDRGVPARPGIEY